MSLSEQESIDNQQTPANPIHHDDQGGFDTFEEKELVKNHLPEIQEAEAQDDQTLKSDLLSEEIENELKEGDEAYKNQPHRQQFEKFLSDLETVTDPEVKLQMTIEFMESALAQVGSPHFKSFWEARNVCLQLFKETINPSVRTLLWTRYHDLSKEARRLKEILDEQSAFAVEQIEIAVKALEDDINAFEEHLEKMSPVDFQVSGTALKKNLSHYERLQRELNLLNTQASRINALRKELIRTEMRVRQKNKFFQRLSLAGDKVFPKRKELIKEVSQRFIEDVDKFIQDHFSKQDFENPLFALREEIKMLQNMAKILTLNTHAFTHTRMRLSESWDRVKNEDKERKKERTQQKVVWKQNFEGSLQQLDDFKKKYEELSLSPSEALKQIDELIGNIRSLEYSREELARLKSEVQSIKKPIFDHLQAQQDERLNQDQEKEKQRRQKLLDIKKQVEDLIKTSDDLTAEDIEQRRHSILEEVSLLTINKAEKLEIERQMKPLRDLISEKRESSLLSLSDDDKQALLQLKEVLKQRKERRLEIKSQIDLLRKSSGASGLDFEQAMNVNAQVAGEKERLEKINQGIEEVERKISQLSKR